jgi:6-phosphofructokinase 1
MYTFLNSHGKKCYEGEPISAVRFASIMKRMCGMVEARATVIGYTQRGANPTAKDSAFAFEAGNMAVQLLRDGVSNQVIGLRNGRVFYMPISQALTSERAFNASCTILSTPCDNPCNITNGERTNNPCSRS